MLKELWEDWLFIVDYLLLSIQSDVLLITYLVIGLLVLYHIMYPIVRFIIVLEWSTFMTYMMVILCLFLFSNLLPQADSTKFVMYAIIIFSLVISSRRGITLIKQSRKS